ncbi:MAG: bifunctional metallophosphatase/5'-nucleotidase [Acidobacteriota bacterium]|nr:bifunctional metallophosphatase/5'-nucleotidase [Acidobacteriota bacterium]
MVPSLRRPASLLLLLCGLAAGEIRTLTILHVNDLHARLSPLENKRGGFAYLASAIRRERAGCRDCVLLNAGDVAQGTPVSTIFHGLPVFEIANLLGIDAATLGNHDFDYGWPQTRKFLETARYPIVSCNLVGGRGQLFTREPYVILAVNGLRVAVLGAMTQTLDTLTTPQIVQEWHALPVVETVRRYARELKAKSDIVVLLAHITPEEELDVLSHAPEIPVTVSGHMHNGLPQPLNEGGRILVRVRGYSRELGRLELRVDTKRKAPVAWNWKKIAVDSAAFPPAKDVAQQVRHWEDEVSARVDRPLAVSARAFNKAEVRALIERAMRAETGADFAFMNLGGVRDVLPQGQLKERNIWDVMPFDNRLVSGRFKGKDLPAVVLGGRKADPERTYTLAVTDFTAANQGTEENLRVTGLKFPADHGLLRDALIDWFRKKKVIE